jgi:hypothetical protein
MILVLVKVNVDSFIQIILLNLLVIFQFIIQIRFGVIITP